MSKTNKIRSLERQLIAEELKNLEKTKRIIALESENYTLRNELKNACNDLSEINLALDMSTFHKNQAG